MRGSLDAAEEGGQRVLWLKALQDVVNTLTRREPHALAAMARRPTCVKAGRFLPGSSTAPRGGSIAAAALWGGVQLRRQRKAATARHRGSACQHLRADICVNCFVLDILNDNGV